jgi:phenylalanyl-tRNA synthetase beta chain
MIIDLNWLKNIINKGSFDGGSIVSSLTSQGLEVDSYDEINDVIDISITPNRGDCFSHLGIARELTASENYFFDAYNYIKHPLDIVNYKKDSVNHFGAKSFYTATLTNIDNNFESQGFKAIRETLKKCGLRSISPIVDITNYVMMLTGQPMHAYDVNFLDGPLQSKLNNADVSIKLLDNNVYEIDRSFLVISDNKKIVGLAGIMGGHNTEVSVKTKAIVLETANFDVEIIRGKARKLGLHTEASLRFERHVDESMTQLAFEHAVYLIKELCNAELDSATSWSKPMTENLVSLSILELNKCLGLTLDPTVITSILNNLGFLSHSTALDELTIAVPSWRNDIAIPEDLYEEVARMYGYDNIPVNNESTGSIVKPATSSFGDEIRALLSAYGYSECVNLTLTSEAIEELTNSNGPYIRVDNPISTDLGLLRSNLASTLLPNAAHNIKNVIMPINHYEMGTVFNYAENNKLDEHESLAVISNVPKNKFTHYQDIVVKDVINQILNEIICKHTLRSVSLKEINHKLFAMNNGYEVIINDNVIGIIGMISRNINQFFNIDDELYYLEINVDLIDSLNKKIEYKAFSRLPSVRRDISFFALDSLRFDQISNALNKANIAILSDFFIFDIYIPKKQKNYKKSMGLALILHNESSTLLDSEIDSAVANAVSTLEKAFAITLKGS